MLPDFVNIKSKLAARLTKAIRPTRQSDSIVKEASHHTIHEGDQWELHRADGSTEKAGYSAYEGGIEVGFDELESEGIQAIKKALSTMRESLLEQAEKEMLSEIERISEEAGTTTDAQGEPFTAELFLESLRKLAFSFDEDGNWNRPQLVIHPDHVDRVADELERLESDPDLRSQLEDLIEQKREAWRERESRRRVVD